MFHSCFILVSFFENETDVNYAIMRGNNQNIKNIQLQNYGNGIFQKRFSKFVSLRAFFASIFYGNDEKTLEIDQKLTALSSKRIQIDPDLYKKQRKRLKEQLPYVVAASVSDGKRRMIAHIDSFTGIITLDFDKFETNDNAVAFRDALFYFFPFILA